MPLVSFSDKKIWVSWFEYINLYNGVWLFYLFFRRIRIRTLLTRNQYHRLKDGVLLRLRENNRRLLNLRGFGRQLPLQLADATTHEKCTTEKNLNAFQGSFHACNWTSQISLDHDRQATFSANGRVFFLSHLNLFTQLKYLGLSADESSSFC